MEKDNMPKYIAIEGPIGVGKTSLARKIALEFGHDLCLEDPDDNPFLQSFYENSQKYAFAMMVLCSLIVLWNKQLMMKW